LQGQAGIHVQGELLDDAESGQWQLDRADVGAADELELAHRADCYTVALSLNTRPRQTLGRKTPREALDEALRATAA
jgi:hypothetical protein